MKKLALAALLALPVLAPAPAVANADIEATQACFADNTSGRDRKALARWVFLAMAAHPEIQALANAGSAENEAADREMAALFMRLVAEDCNAQMKRMLASQGPESFKTAFEYLGQLAMAELMANPSVGARFSGFEKFVDTERLQGALQLP